MTTPNFALQDADTLNPTPPPSPAMDNTPMPSYAPPPPKTGLQGVIQRLPRAFATIAAYRGNPAPLNQINEQEHREDQLRQQAFNNTITGQREQRAQQMYDVQLKNFQAELTKRGFEQQEAQRKSMRDQQTGVAQAIAAHVPQEFIHPDGLVDASKLPPEVAQRYLETVGGKEFGKPDTQTLQDGSVVQWDENTRVWKPAMIRMPNPQIARDQMFGGAPGAQGPAPAMASNYQLPAPSVDVPMTAMPKATNVKELLQAQINQAAQSGDSARVAELQQRLKQIDPEGQQRIYLAQDTNKRNNSKFDVDYPTGTDGTRIKRSDITQHDRNYVQPAEAIEKSWQMMDNAYQEYKALKAKGKDFPTGAQSMLALSTHLQTTFGQVKGARVTKDMIAEHLHARSISDDAEVAVNKLVNGGRLSAGQWEAFHDLVKQSRDLSWKTAAKEAKRHQIPVDFLPDDVAGADEPNVTAPTKPGKRPPLTSFEGKQ